MDKGFCMKKHPSPVKDEALRVQSSWLEISILVWRGGLYNQQLSSGRRVFKSARGEGRVLLRVHDVACVSGWCEIRCLDWV